MARVKIEVDDQVSAKLIRLGKVAPQSLDRALKHATTSLKGYIIDSEIRVFGRPFSVRDNDMSFKATKFKKTGKMRYKLSTHPRFQVFERGADIFPKNKPLIKFKTKEGVWVSTNWVTIPKKPFFQRGLRDAIRADAINKSLEQSINLEFKRLGLV